MSKDPEENLLDLPHIQGTAVAPAVAIGALALNFAMKYHDINTVQDGTLYQQFKLEGKNMQPLHLDHVFDTAKLMEMHLIGSSQRIANMVVDALLDVPEEFRNSGDLPSDDEIPAE